MKRLLTLLLIPLFLQSFSQRIRQPVDTVGFSHLDWQTDSVMKRIDRVYGNYYKYTNNMEKEKPDVIFRTAICPHDDYAYAGYMYPRVLSKIKAKTIIIFGVAHKAKKFNIENQLVFDSFDSWKAPYGDQKISALREKLIAALPAWSCLVSDSLQQAEHSVEALVLFLRYYNKKVEIVSVLVPYMPYSRMDSLALRFSIALSNIMKEEKLEWGKDIAILISTDAVHYGDEDWGDKNYAPYGTDSTGYVKALSHEMTIITECLVPDVSVSRVKKFIGYTTMENDYKEYKWTWCGRYSVPFGLLTSYYLTKQNKATPLKGFALDYATSITRPPLKVDDLIMGTTAIATRRHWVGYAAIGYK